MATEEIGNLQVRVGLDGTGFQSGVGAINKQLAVVKSEVSLARAKFSDFGKTSDGLKDKMNLLNKQITLQGQKVSVLTEAYNKSVDSKGKDAKATQDLEIKLNNAKTAMTKMQNELGSTEKKLKEASSLSTRFSNSLDKMSKKLKSVGQNMTSAGRSMTIGLTAPIIGVGYAAGKASIDFESAFTGVTKTVNGTAAELENLKKGVREMSLQMPEAATSIASVEEAAGQLGIKTKNIEGFTKVMVQLGDSTNLTANEAATDMARLANITQMPQTEFGKLGSTVVALGNNMATTESEIVGMSLRLSGASHQVGINQDQTLGFSAALSSLGIEAEAGGTAFSKVMIKIANSVANGGKEMEKLAKVSGMTGDQFKKSFQTDAAGTIVSFIEGLGKMEKSGKNVFGVLDDLGLSAIRTRDALLRASGSGDLFRKSLEIASKAWKDNTALQKEAQQRYATTASQLQLMKNKLTDISITLGDALIPALLKSLDALQPLFNLVKEAANWFSGLNKPMQETLIIIGSVVAISGPVLVGLGMMATGIGTVTAAFGSLDIATGGIILAIGAVVTGLVVAGVYLYKHWDSIKTYLLNFWAWLKNFFNQWGAILVILTPFIGIPLLIVTKWDAIKTPLVAIWNFIKSTAINLFNNMKDGITKIWDGLKLYFEGMWKFFKTLFLGSILIILDLVTGNFGKLKKDLKGIWDNIKDAFGTSWEGIKNIFSGGIEAIIGYFKSAFDFFENLPNQFYTIGSHIVRGLVNGITSMIGRVKAAISNVAHSISNGIRGALGINSPSRVMMEIGKFTGEGLIIGMAGTISNISKQAKLLATAAIPQNSNLSFNGSISGGSRLGGGNINVQVTGNHISSPADENRLADKISQKIASDYGISTGGAY